MSEVENTRLVPLPLTISMGAITNAVPTANTEASRARTKRSGQVSGRSAESDEDRRRLRARASSSAWAMASL